MTYRELRRSLWEAFEDVELTAQDNSVAQEDKDHLISIINAD